MVSMIGDHFGERIPQQYPWTQGVNTTSSLNFHNVSREEFEALKRDVEEMKLLLIKAKLYDEANSEPDCEMEEKIELLKRIAELVGVDLDDLFNYS